MRYLGIDYGLAKIGLALGESDGEAYPIEEISAEGAIPAIVKVIAEDGVDEIVVGIPVDIEGEPTKQSEITQQFITLLKDALAEAGMEKPVHEVDERNTSQESRRLQQETGTMEGKDALAAMLILKDYLSR